MVLGDRIGCERKGDEKGSPAGHKRMGMAKTPQKSIDANLALVSTHYLSISISTDERGDTRSTGCCM